MKSRINNRMKGFLIFSLFISLIAYVNQAFCQEFFMAKVITVNAEEKKVEVAPILSKQELDAGKKVRNIFVEANFALPDCVTAGALIRLWGEQLPGGVNTFIATDIRGCRGGGCQDPTGVRSRLSRKGKKYLNIKNDDSAKGMNKADSGLGNSDGNGGHGGNGNGGGGGGGGGR
jgi:hypothetical protein